MLIDTMLLMMMKLIKMLTMTKRLPAWSPSDNDDDNYDDDDDDDDADDDDINTDDDKDATCMVAFRHSSSTKS